MLYGLKVSDDIPSPSITLQLLSEWNHNYVLTSLATYGDHVVAGDQISSVSILKVSDSRVHNVARDYGPLWPICVEASDEANIIGANVEMLPFLPSSRFYSRFYTGCIEPLYVHFDTHTRASVS
jgi:hypothetical protein